MPETSKSINRFNRPKKKRVLSKMRVIEGEEFNNLKRSNRYGKPSFSHYLWRKSGKQLQLLNWLHEFSRTRGFSFTKTTGLRSRRGNLTAVKNPPWKFWTYAWVQLTHLPRCVWRFEVIAKQKKLLHPEFLLWGHENIWSMTTWTYKIVQQHQSYFDNNISA